MLRHYLEVKAEHPDSLLLYRMGDFYELFFEDAVEAAPILEVQLTARQKGTPSEAPMCGVPHHAVEGYIARLIEAGKRVAVCDQVEDPATAKGMVRREVTRIVTPGMVLDPDQLAEGQHNFLAAIEWDGDGGAGAFLELSTGAFRVQRWASPAEAVDELAMAEPREALVDSERLPTEVLEFLELAGVRITERDIAIGSGSRVAAGDLKRHFGVSSLRSFDLKEREPATLAAAAALTYAERTQGLPPQHIKRLEVVNGGETSVLDATTLRNLEILRNLRDGGREATLLSVLDSTQTAGGARTLAEWLSRPLLDRDRIEVRLDAVDELLQQAGRASELRDRLAAVADIERLASRAALNRMRPREAEALRSSLQQVPVIQELCREFAAELLQAVSQADALEDLTADLEATLADEPAVQVIQGGVIAEGVDAELDEARSLAGSGKQHLMSIQAEEREATGISNLKVRYNKVFGYYLEVSKAQSDKVPDHYVRKQTLVNAERFITDELKDLEDKILSAEGRQIEREVELFDALVARIAEHLEGLAALAGLLSSLDALASFADRARRADYVRPVIAEPGEAIVIEEGRHPVVEAVSSESFVPNDCTLGGEDDHIVILTGPNMGGKSTYLRQVALISVLAQAGSFVPAKSARLGLVDRVFSRVGASDDLARGESTFMVEMIETARILHQATGNSLVILDEVGRGTATFDGLSLAWAIVEHLHRVKGLKALFATHYHELTELAVTLDRVGNQTLAVREWEDKVVFLRRVIPGSADKSYGLHVASLAGIPEPVVARAGEILANLEAQEYDHRGRPTIAKSPAHAESGGDQESKGDKRAADRKGAGEQSAGKSAVGETAVVGEEQQATTQAAPSSDQLTLFAPPEEIVASILRDVDVDALSPLAALNLINTLRDRLGGSGGQ